MKPTLQHGTKPQTISPDDITNCNRILFRECLCQIKANGETGQFEAVLQWASVAAWFASRKGWFGELGSHELETELLRAARSLPIPTRKANAGTPPRWLHVLTEAYATLGHTNLCRRWIQYDDQVTHNVMLLDQKGAAPENLVDTVKKAGGACFVLDPMTPLLERAKVLRDYAWQNADVVVLHIHPEDVIATTAFGVAGGPPVLLVNHADHVFWVGCSVADLVIDIRASGNLWTRHARGIDRTAILPLPLLNGQDAVTKPQWKRAIRKELGIPEDDVVILTVGSAAKYQPMPGLNFINTATTILEQSPGTRIIAVGPEDEGPWRTARCKTHGRFLPLGRQPDSTLFCKAADIYLEGFPAGSLTALLEAAEAGLPCVLAPGEILPPYCTDDPAIENITQPKNIEDYVRTVVALAHNPKNCAEIGRELQRAVRSQHCGEGWLAHLRKIKTLIPGSHSLHPDFKPTPVDSARRDWFVQYLHATGDITTSAVATEVFLEAWKQTLGRPKITESLWDELHAARAEGERESLQCFNRRIARWGIRTRLIARANLALAYNRPAIARKLTYSCLLQTLSSLTHPDWIKLFVKSHLSTKWLQEFQRVWRGQARKSPRSNLSQRYPFSSSSLVSLELASVLNSLLG